ncbi:hypothetical protein JAAARDRAFT_210755 [Jaapia argillacea MUCL 33604]|uniref:Uncharacterized protein n=1 Tax=Jaapia argillacea MUCL 33604 TaxID=933084 RepID=A0A067PLU0_9AGAM|nr:hypothetical protein JAAARDRAFT_210755 [Jaapia argillacea MUCL 33604]
MPTKVSLLVLITSILVVSAAALPISRSVVCLPTTWHDIIVFFVVNYVAHAATIPTVAGAKWYDTTCWTILSLLLPFAGLGKSIGLILNHMMVGSSDLEKASSRDALLIAVRADDWEPSRHVEEIYVILPEDFQKLDESPSNLPSAAITVDDSSPFQRATMKHLQIHGAVILPKGYDLAYPYTNTIPEIFPFRSPRNTIAPLCHSQSWVKMAISVAQLVYSCVTIYRTRGDQLDRYGYAAFGLSVFPYTFMSLANFVCVGLAGEYSSVYVLRTAIAKEVEGRGGTISGAVGVCDAGNPADEREHVDGTEEAAYWAKFTRATISMKGESYEDHIGQRKEDDDWKSKGDVEDSEEDDDSLLQRILVITVNGVTRKFKYRPGRSADYVFEISSIANQNRIPEGGFVYSLSSRGTWALVGGIFVGIIGALILPYVVIDALSGFKARKSTFAERAWMMAWLSSGQLSFLIFGFFGIMMPHFSPTSWRAVYDYIDHSAAALLLPIIVLLPVPAVGGFVTVVKMLMASGTCSLAP